jgi:pilus assembly protein CpaB
VRRRLLAAIAALVLLVAGTLVLLAYVQGADARALAGTRTVDVLVVDQLIPEGTSGDELTEFVTTETLPAKAALDGRVTDLSDLSGRVATVDLQVGEQLLKSRFARPDSLQAPGTVPVPDGLQEISVLLEPQRVIGTRLAAGDTVGVYCRRSCPTARARPPRSSTTCSSPRCRARPHPSTRPPTATRRRRQPALPRPQPA